MELGRDARAPNGLARADEEAGVGVGEIAISGAAAEKGETAKIGDGEPASSAAPNAAANGLISGAYRRPSATPTQEAPHGVRFDFNDGCRVVVPEADKPWHVRISDLDTGNTLFKTEIKAGAVNSTKRYFVRFRIEVGGRRRGASRTTIQPRTATSWRNSRSARWATRWAGFPTR